MMSQKPSGSVTKTVANPHYSPERIQQDFVSTGNVAATIAQRSAMVDELVQSAYAATLAPVFPHGLTIVAVGGFGRRDLFPHSDIDILILAEREIQGNEQRDALSAFLRTLWDSHLRVSQSVRSVPECCELDSQNVELTISLIDQRFLTGDRDLYETLSARLPKFFLKKRQELVKHLREMTTARHAKYHHTIYHLEPNIKETPGGMRDLHVAQWLIKLRESDDDALQLLSKATDFLSRVRCRLHYKFGRDNNVLNFDAQEEFSSQDPAPWMRQYFRHAREIHRAAMRQLDIAEAAAEGSLIRQFQDWRSRLSNAEFTVNRERLYFKSPQQLQMDPELALRMFQFVARHGIRLSVDAERRVQENLPMLRDHFSYTRLVWPLLSEIFEGPYGALAVRSMNDTGLLPAIFPEWEKIESLVVRDFYHRYTVDEHTIVTLENLNELATSTDPSRRRFKDLLAESEDLAVLWIALLFHDVGKGDGFENHSQRSAELAKEAFARIQMPAEASRTALFLIDQHLTLSDVMTGRDLSDPKTAFELAHAVGTIENLRYLALLTYADISAVNPDAMTRWRLEQLWRVYLIGHKELTKELDTERIHGAAGDETRAFLEGFPTRYLRTHSEEEIKWHIDLEKLSRVAGVAVDLQRHEGTFRVTVVTSDRPSLFASLAGTLSGFGMNIVKAEAFANEGGTVLDTFTFEDPLRTLELNPAEIDRLKLTLQRAVLGKEDVRKLLKGRSRPSQPGKTLRIEPSVSFDSEASGTATLVEIVAEDRAGLLYDIAETFSTMKCSIEVVLIDTEAHKALDVFYVTSGGKKLDEDTQTAVRAELLRVCKG